MASATVDLQVKGLDRRAMTKLRGKARRLGMTPERYVRELVEEDLALDRKAQEISLMELMGPGRKCDRGELDKLVETSRRAGGAV